MKVQKVMKVMSATKAQVKMLIKHINCSISHLILCIFGGQAWNTGGTIFFHWWGTCPTS